MQAVPVKFSFYGRETMKLVLRLIWFYLFVSIGVILLSADTIKWLILGLGDKKNVNSYLLEYFFHKFIRI